MPSGCGSSRCCTSSPTVTSRPGSTTRRWPSTRSRQSSRRWAPGWVPTRSPCGTHSVSCGWRSCRCRTAFRAALAPSIPARMPSRIEQYALIGDTQTAGLVADDGSLDWLCAPRFDSPACFAALVGDDSHGRWLLGPAAGGRAARRQYRDGTLVLETEFETPEGAVRIIDFMPLRDKTIDVIRIVEGIRVDYGSIVPWMHRHQGGLHAIAGPDALVLHTPVNTRGEDMRTVAEFTVRARERIPFVLAYLPSTAPVPEPADAEAALVRTSQWWRRWSARSTFQGEWSGLVRRSAITLKAVSYTHLRAHETR